MRLIKNLEELTKDSKQIRKDLLEILEYALRESLPESAVTKTVRLEGDELKIANERLFLSEIGNIFVIGSGKATYRMAKSLYNILGERISKGIITINESSKKDIGPIKVIQAGHPIPSEKGIKGANDILSLVEKTERKDLIIALISGGGSALLAAPLEGITLPDLQKTNELLLKSGASIKEINTIRKHISKIKGGRLSGASYPANLISLIISDVVGDDLSTIASGPTVGDKTTYQDAYDVLEKYYLTEKIPFSVLSKLKEGMEGQIPETPFPDDESLSTTLNKIILSNAKTLESAQRKASQLGYNTTILSSKMEGKAEKVGIFHGEIAREVTLSGIPVKPPAIILSGGECVVSLGEIGKEKGGPNQECVIGFAKKIGASKKIVFLSVDTDGIDGFSEFAGGIIGGNTAKIYSEKIKEALTYHSSSDYLREIGGGIITGKTGTNVNDLRILGIAE